jgi:mono/diheme cytochrome c family protein
MRNVAIQIGFLSLLAVTVVYAKAVPDQDTENRAAGQKLFKRHCAECHGPAGEGTDRAPSLRQFVRSTPPHTLHSFIKNGNLRAGMPSWSRLPNEQIWQLVNYLQSLEP